MMFVISSTLPTSSASHSGELGRMINVAKETSGKKAEGKCALKNNTGRGVTAQHPLMPNMQSLPLCP